MTKLLVKPLLLALGVLAGFFVANSVLSSGCQELYGGYAGGVCPRGEVLIDKLVFKPGDKGTEGVFVDNLSTSDHKFTATQEVIFKLTVKNTSSVFLDKIEVKDVLPNEFEYVSGPEGASFDSSTREIKFDVKDMKAGESRDFEIKTKVVTADRLPEGQTTCVVNVATAHIPEDDDKDTAQVCIERPVVEKLPEAGPGEWLVVLGASSVAGVAGLKFLNFHEFEI
ncbi:MAG: DUF11 domain-containing protein [Candidatus Chisholmbacteria bacterium]|nr:DUF11 domain-containing protein [Candidatus Chisholmbacteria bacterium]